jgi:hypothetical protein
LMSWPTAGEEKANAQRSSPERPLRLASGTILRATGKCIMTFVLVWNPCLVVLIAPEHELRPVSGALQGCEDRAWLQWAYSLPSGTRTVREKRGEVGVSPHNYFLAGLPCSIFVHISANLNGLCVGLFSL